MVAPSNRLYRSTELAYRTQYAELKERAQGGLLTHGPALGRAVPVPSLNWHAQTVPFYDHLLRAPDTAAMLAGGHCVQVRIPSAHRFVWHKLYASGVRTSFPEKAEKDLLQAATLAAVLVKQQDEDLSRSWRQLPVPMRRRVKGRLPALRRVLEGHPQALEAVERALGRALGD